VTPGRVMATLAAVALMVSGCGGDETAASGSRQDERLQAASQGLCDAQALVAEGDVVQAARVFERETHAYLHELAARLGEVDRGAAADLLQAKQRLEHALATPEQADPVAVAELIPLLQRALIDGAEAADLPRPLCREGGAV
jgi:hypothetical protein